MTPRDKSLIHHLAEKVMGWRVDDEHIVPGDLFVRDGAVWIERRDRERHWNPLESWADAGMVWERVREMGIQLDLIASSDRWFGRIWQGPASTQYQATSAPRAISEAVAFATGWVEEIEL